MKKIFLGFIAGLFVSLIIYFIWAIYQINTFNSKVSPSFEKAFGKESVERTITSQLDRAEQLMKEALLAHENGREKEKCQKWKELIRIYNNLANYYKTEDWYSDVKEMRADYEKSCQ
jgi:hypothetical protein